MRKLMMIAATAAGILSVQAQGQVLSGQPPVTVNIDGTTMAARSSVDMTAVLRDENGKPGRDYFGQQLKPGETCADCPPLTLGRAAAHALMAQLAGDDKDFEQKWARAVLAERIKEDPHASLTAAETATIEKRLGEVYGGLVLYQAFPLLDPNRQPPPVK